MVKNNELKFEYGFSLVEALVVMAIAAIFVAVIASVIPHKAKPKTSAVAHGGFACYWNEDKLYSKVFTGGAEGEATEQPEGREYCVFSPNPYVPYLVFNVVGGGSAGGEDDGGGAGRFASSFFPTPQRSYNLYPGKGGVDGNDEGKGGESYVIANGTRITTAGGGNNTSNANALGFSDIIEVYIAGHLASNTPGYGCNTYPKVWLNNATNHIHVKFCKSSSNIGEDEFEFSNSNYTTDSDKYKTIIDSPLKNTPFSRQKPNTADTWEYYDVGVFRDLGLDPTQKCNDDQITNMNDGNCPLRYKLEFKLNIVENGEDGAVSDLTKYAKLMKYNTFAGIKPGNGGAKGRESGKTGAILVSW